MECLYCRGRLERGEVSYSDTRNGYVLVLNEVPAWVCRQCGEPLFDGDAVRLIQGMLGHLDEQSRQLRKAA